MNFKFLIIFCSGLAFSSVSFSEESLWEYGVGLGYVQFQQYPAANQYSNLFLPFPTFQYRGKILRADDRDGAHIYLYKKKNWNLELSGGGYAAANSTNNTARSGMADLPWMLYLGPQAHFSIYDDLDFRLGIYQAIATDFKYTRFSGSVFESKLIYQWNSKFNFQLLRLSDSLIEINGTLSVSAIAASQEFLETYFEVRPQFVTAERPEFRAKSGFLNFEWTYFQTLKMGRTSVYAGLSTSDFTGSANRKSPLHKSNYNTSYLIGMTYSLGESTKPSVPENKTDNLIKGP